MLKTPSAGLAGRAPAAGAARNPADLRYQYPFSQDFSQNASLAGWLIPGSAQVVGGALQISPSAGAELFTNGGMENWTSATDAANWTEGKGGTSSINREDADIHGGAHAARFDIDGSNSFAQMAQAVVAPAYSWIRVAGWHKATNSKQATVRLAAGAGGRAFYGTPALGAAYTQHYGIQRTDAANPSIEIARSGTATSSSIYHDDFSAVVESMVSCGAFRRIGQRSGYQILAKLSATGSFNVPWGIWVVDDPYNPQNGLLAWIDMLASKAYLSNLSNGSWSDLLVAQTITYGLAKKLGLNRNGETCKLLYDGVQIGGDQVVDAAIQNAQYVGLFATDAANKFASFEVLPPFEFSLALMSDVHVGRTWSAGEVDAVMTAIDSKNPSIVIATGDLTETGLQAEVDSFNASVALISPATVYKLRGNHDHTGGAGRFDDRISFEYGRFKFIGFYASYIDVSPPLYANEGSVSAEDLAWAESELQALNGKTPILMCHYPLASEIAYPADIHSYIGLGRGKEELLAMCATYGVKVFLSGHTHIQNFPKSVQGVTTHLGLPSMVDTSGGFVICEVFADRLQFRMFSSRTPFALLRETTVMM